jgi:hypothetical protein
MLSLNKMPMNHFMLYSPDQTKCVSIACKRMEIKSDHVLNAVNSSRVNEIGFGFVVCISIV